MGNCWHTSCWQQLARQNFGNPLKVLLKSTLSYFHSSWRWAFCPKIYSLSKFNIQGYKAVGSTNSSSTIYFLCFINLYIRKNTGELLAARSDPRSHLYSVDVLEKTQRLEVKAAVSETRLCPNLWLKHKLIPFWSGRRQNAGAEIKQKGFRHIPPTFLARPATKWIVPPARLRQSGPARHNLNAETGRPVCTFKKNQTNTKKQNKTDIAMPQERPTELHGEVSRVVVFYCGDDRLDKLEEDQKIPETWLKKTRRQKTFTYSRTDYFEPVKNSELYSFCLAF